MTARRTGDIPSREYFPANFQNAGKFIFLVQLKRSRVSTEDIITYYRACICSVMDYACPIFHYSLPKYLQCDLARIQRRAMAIVFPYSNYKEALLLAGLSTVNDRQNQLTINHS